MNSSMPILDGAWAPAIRRDGRRWWCGGWKIWREGRRQEPGVSPATGGAGLNVAVTRSRGVEQGTARDRILAEAADIENKQLNWKSQIRRRNPEAHAAVS